MTGIWTGNPIWCSNHYYLSSKADWYLTNSWRKFFIKEGWADVRPRLSSFSFDVRSQDGIGNFFSVCVLVLVRLEGCFCFCCFPLLMPGVGEFPTPYRALEEEMGRWQLLCISYPNCLTDSLASSLLSWEGSRSTHVPCQGEKCPMIHVPRFWEREEQLEEAYCLSHPTT